MVARAGEMVATRERIVRAALKLALEQAFEDITLAAIAEAAGVSHQTVLNHFASKENVAAAAAEMLDRQTRAARDKARPNDHPRRIAILVGEYQRFGDAGARWAMASEQLGSLAPLLDAHAPATRHGSIASFRISCRRPRPSAATRFTRCTRPRMSTRGSSSVATCSCPALTPSGSCSNWLTGSWQRWHGNRTPPVVFGEDAMRPRQYLFTVVDGGGNVPPDSTPHDGSSTGAMR